MIPHLLQQSQMSAKTQEVKLSATTKQRNTNQQGSGPTHLDERPRGRPAQHGHLPGVDAIGTVLPGMVHADDAIYDGFVDAVWSRPRAAWPQGRPVGGERPPSAATCRRDRGERGSAAVRPRLRGPSRKAPAGRQRAAAAPYPQSRSALGAAPVSTAAPESELRPPPSR